MDRFSPTLSKPIHPAALKPATPPNGRVLTGAAAPVFQETIFHKVGFYLLLTYLFVYLSRILELTVPSLRLTMVLNLGFVLAAVATGAILKIFKTRAGVLMIGFFCWMIVCFPFSVWRGGSVEFMIQAAQQSASRWRLREWPA
jgi:hypothetical protein